MAINRILLAYDGSSDSRQALEQASELARLSGATIEIMLVVPLHQAVEASRAMWASYREDLEAEAYQAVEQARNRLVARGLSAHGHVRVGHPAEEVVRRAEDEGFDLIVIGSRGLGALPRFFLGSVSSRVVAHAPCSVLVVKS